MSITLTGTFTRLDGDPATGTVRVTPSRSPIMDPDGKIVISGPQVFPLDADGKIAVNVPASNDPDLGPPFTYTVEALLSHKPWKISKVWIPHGSATVDLSEIGDYTPLPGEPTRTVTVPADGADGQVLVWDGAGFSWDYNPGGKPGPRGPQGPAIDINTGLPISVDTTVGTRVFIGGQMVHGDTGWRVITSWDTEGTITGQPLTSGLQPTAGVAGFIRLRRVGKETQFHMAGVTVTSTDVRFNLPEGFRGIIPYFRETVATSNSAFGVMFGHWLGVYIRMNGAVIDGSYGVGVRFECESTWPIALPGTPN